MTLRVTVDYGKCCGYGICAEVCPEVFGIGPAGLAVVKDADVGEEIEEKTREAAECCPELAINLAPS